MYYSNTTNPNIVDDARLLMALNAQPRPHLAPIYPPTTSMTLPETSMTAEEALDAARNEGLELKKNDSKTGFMYVYDRSRKGNRKRPFAAEIRRGLDNQEYDSVSLGYYATPQEAALVVARFLRKSNQVGMPKARTKQTKFPEFCSREMGTDGKNVFTCKTCNTKYKTRNGVRDHCRREHGLMPIGFKPIGTETTHMEPKSFLASQSLTNDPAYKEMIEQGRRGHTLVPSIRVSPTTTNSAYKRMIEGLPTNPNSHISSNSIIGTANSFVPSQKLTDPFYIDALDKLKKRRQNGGKKRTKRKIQRTRRKIQKTKRKIQKTKNGKYKKHTKKHKFIIK